MSPLHATTFATPCGPFSVALDPTGAVVATAFGPLPRLRSRLPASCHLISDKPAFFSAVKEEVEGYFAGYPGRSAGKLAGERQAPGRRERVKLAAVGTAFQQRVWTALREIPWGETRSYGKLAAALGQPGAARAIGRANATNPICLLVPCHRVIGADGSLTGFAFGNDIKRQLLLHEGALKPDLLTP